MACCLIFFVLLSAVVCQMIALTENVAVEHYAAHIGEQSPVNV